MEQTWEDMLTNKQKKQLIREGVEELEKVVDSQECKDILKDIKISCIYTFEKRHEQVIYLTQEGVVEVQTCKGHDYKDMADEPSTDYCKGYNKRRIVPQEEFTEIIECYRLTPKQISELYAKLK